MNASKEKDNYIVETGIPYPLGATLLTDGINFSVAGNGKDTKGVSLLLFPNGEKININFRDENRIGNVAAIKIKGIEATDCRYRFYGEDGEYIDKYSKKVFGNEVWGEKVKEANLFGGFTTDVFDWERDSNPMIPYDESIFYCLHVRGFTKHESSKVKYPGTYRGLTEKIPYLKKLGITAVELMPSYEYLENSLQKPESLSQEYAALHAFDHPEENRNKVNYWGYTKGYYFCPKASYASDVKSVETEFKQMVKKLHQNNIEITMQFYFPDEYKAGYILDVVKYWVTEYHIDGVHLKGSKVPITLLATEPLLTNTKLMYDYIPDEEIYILQEKPIYRNLCRYTDNFMYQMRRFLKGDEDSCLMASNLMKENPEKYAIMNFITNYYGFTLHDLVSYEIKRNEDNGENNRDGTDNNFSWNCGEEGITKKSSILKLRKKQMKNALMLVFLSQGTPLIMSGDEFMNSQSGNNNPYCQDNEITWLNWNLTKSGRELLVFTRNLILLRKEQPFLSNKSNQNKDSKNMYSELSYHGEEAFKADFHSYNHQFAVMYTNHNRDQKYEAIYLAFNMHWKRHEFAFPKLPKGKKWVRVCSSALWNDDSDSEIKKEIEERSIQVFIAK